MGAPEAWSAEYLVETKVASHAKSQEKPRRQNRSIPSSNRTRRKTPLTTNGHTRQLPHTAQVYELTAPNVVITHRRHDERYTIQAEGTAANDLYTWATRGSLPQPLLPQAPSWPTPFHTADRPNKRPKHAGVHTAAHEAQHQDDTRCKAHTLHDDQTIPRISARPTSVSDATHNRKMTGIVTDCLSPAAGLADTVRICKGGSHTRALARHNYIQPHKLQRAV